MGNCATADKWTAKGVVPAGSGAVECSTTWDFVARISTSWRRGPPRVTAPGPAVEGAGLIVARGFVEAVNGELAVEPAPDGGTAYALGLAEPVRPG
ncbi:hypothetical protein [Kitasatospora sp. NPDC058478]|uniref:hypothetical protein n=1 Tax=unclassified Kitasatospora TaxID=2633591 RepID=UPI0036663476